MNENKTFGEIIKRQRLKKGLTQKEVAEEIGIHFGTYQKYEYEERIPDGKIMLKLIKFFELDIDEVEKALD